jgi:hypothetical protein
VRDLVADVAHRLALYTAARALSISYVCPKWDGPSPRTHLKACEQFSSALLFCSRIYFSNLSRVAFINLFATRPSR